MVMQLHDIAVVYLGLAHGADGELDQTEARTIAIRLREQQPNTDPALIDHVLREAVMTYTEGRSGAVEEAVISLKKLPEERRLTLLKDLTSIARADRRIETTEIDFIEHIATEWGLADFPLADSASGDE